jgi:hypothetical protein
MDFSGIWPHGIFVFMSKHDLVKKVPGRANRSGFNQFLTPAFPRNHKPAARFDFPGGVMVVSLFVGVVFLMRLLLAY